MITPSGRFIQRRYHGLRSEEYRAFGGVAGAREDTLETFHTDHGRPVRGGGGIAPDVELPRPARIPVWWSAAADSGLGDALADSFALTSVVITVSSMTCPTDASAGSTAS